MKKKSNPPSVRIWYFEGEGRQNLPHVINCVRLKVTHREDLRRCKIVVFTALGEGPALAYTTLSKNKIIDYSPTIIAVTFPAGFAGKKLNPDGSTTTIPTGISEDIKRFFDYARIQVLTGRLPFEGFSGAEGIQQQLKLAKSVLSLFGGGFSLCVQAVLQACDMGVVSIGEQVIAISGDCAAVITASTTEKFLTAEDGLSINEILCKPKNLTITRRSPKKTLEASTEIVVKKT